MDTHVSFDPELLLREVSWVRSLARRLVRDAAEAEDVAQDALLVALRSARREPHALRQWLGSVVRNLVHSSHRRKARQALAELATEREGSIPSPPELLERATTQRALVGALVELEETDRTVLLLHHWQGLSNMEIARHWSVPPSTVASRLQRAHARLRAKWLAQNGGDRSTALAALVACTRCGGGPSTALPVSTASVRVASGTLSVAGLASVLLGVAWWWRTAEDPISTPAPLAEASLARVSIAAREQAPPRAPTELFSFLQEGRSVLETAQPASSARCPAPQGQRVPIQGLVLDLEGHPVADLEVCRVSPFVTQPGVTMPAESASWRGERTGDCATSDGAGRFTIVAPQLGWFTASSPGWTTVLGGDLWLAEGGEALLVVARSRALAGHVVDEHGRDLSGVEVALEVAPESLLALGMVLDVTVPVPRVLVTGEDGAFAFDDAPDGRRIVTASKEGFERASVALDDAAHETALRLELRRTTLPTVTGTVVDSSGLPVEGALVSAGQGIVTTDANGAFLVTFDPAHGVCHAHAEHGGQSTPPAATPASMPASITVRAVRADVGLAELEIPFAPSTSAVRLVLARAGRSIAGHVLDPRGVPVPSVEVFVLEDTSFGRVPVDGGFRGQSVESVLGAQPVTTDADGSFRIEGLLERSYRLQALDSEHLSSSISEPVPSGSRGVRLLLDPQDRGPLAGRVVDRAGRPVAGVRVSVSCRQWWSGQEDVDYALVFGTPAESDAEGRFALADVAREGVFLRLEGEPIVPEIFRALDPEQDPTALELVVGRRCHLQIRWGDWSARAGLLHLEDEDGARLDFMDLRGSGVTPMEWMPVDTGLSPPIAIPDHAAHAVLTRAGREVARVRLHPVPGELEVIEP